MGNQETYRHISAEEFSELDFTTVTLSTFLGSGEESDMSLFI